MKKRSALFASLLLLITFATPAQSAGVKYTAYQKTLSSFSSTATTLNSQQKAQVKAAVEANPNAEKFICTGIRYFSQPMSVNIMVRKRAKAACEYAKELNPNLSTWFQNKPTEARSYAGKVLLTIKTPTTPTKDELEQIGETQLDPMQQCELQRTEPWPATFGFPRHENLISAKGRLSGLVVFVEFDDVPASGDPQKDFRSFTEKFLEFYRVNSYGKLQIEMDFIPRYLKIPKESSSYGMNEWNAGDPGMYFHDGLRAAASERNLSQYDFFVILPPPNIREIIYGPAFVDGRGRGIPGLSDLEWLRGTVGGADQRLATTGWIWLSHEIGHVLGMGHQFNDPLGRQPVFDLMDNVYTEKAPGLFAWHRFQMGWLDDSQVRCVDFRSNTSTESFHNLYDINSQSDDVKALILRLSETKAIVVEARFPHALNQIRPDEKGVLVYEVDTSRSSLSPGPIRLLAGSDANELGILQAGQKAESDGYSVHVLRQVGDGYLIRVSS